MDVQAGIVGRIGEPDALLDRLVTAVDAARSAGVPVIFVRVAFRDGYPEVAASNKSFGALATMGGFGESDPAT